MRPAAIIHFERLLLAALALDLVNNLAAWAGVAAKLAQRGFPPHPAAVLFLCLLSPIVGLAFWYMIARRGSVIAKWLLTVFVAFATIGFIATMVRGVAPSALPTFAVAAVGELLKLAAVTRLFTAGAGIWFAHKRTRNLTPLADQ